MIALIDLFFLFFLMEMVYAANYVVSAQGKPRLLELLNQFRRHRNGLHLSVILLSSWATVMMTVTLLSKAPGGPDHSRPPSEEHHATSTGREDTAKPCALPPAITVTTHTGPEDTCSSEEEFQSLLDRVRQNQNLGGRTPASPRPPPGTAHMVSVLFGWIDVAKVGKIGYLKYSGFLSKFLE